ncbi:MAG TPA: hypothetical protein VGK59_07330 [Ohtaekwangia sp.]
MRCVLVWIFGFRGGKGDKDVKKEIKKTSGHSLDFYEIYVMRFFFEMMMPRASKITEKLADLPLNAM